MEIDAWHGNLLEVVLAECATIRPVRALCHRTLAVATYFATFWESALRDCENKLLILFVGSPWLEP
jgi:hypothetical protein